MAVALIAEIASAGCDGTSPCPIEAAREVGAQDCGPIWAGNSEAEQTQARDCIIEAVEASRPFFIEWDNGGTDAAYSAMAGVLVDGVEYAIYRISESNDGRISTSRCASLEILEPHAGIEYFPSLACVDGIRVESCSD